MRAVTGRILSSRPISLSRAARTLSLFSASGTASLSRPELAAYVRRTSEAFDDLVAFHRHLKSPNKNPTSEVGDEEVEKSVSSAEKKKRKGYDGGAEEKRERIVVDTENKGFDDGVIGSEERKRKKSDKEKNRGEEERRNKDEKAMRVKGNSVHRKHKEDVSVEEDKSEHHRKKKKKRREE